ncbi:hypothetical protein ACQKWADRAFT_294363 [Trichoderma austrokoningii]
MDLFACFFFSFILVFGSCRILSLGVLSECIISHAIRLLDMGFGYANVGSTHVIRIICIIIEFNHVPYLGCVI